MLIHSPHAGALDDPDMSFPSAATQSSSLPRGTLRHRPPDPPPNTPDFPNTSNHTNHITNNVRFANTDLVAPFDIPPESTQPRPIRAEFDPLPLPEFRKVRGWLKSQLRVTEYRQRQEPLATDATPSVSNSSGSSRSSPSSGASVERVALLTPPSHLATLQQAQHDWSAPNVSSNLCTTLDEMFSSVRSAYPHPTLSPTETESSNDLAVNFGPDPFFPHAIDDLGDVELDHEPTVEGFQEFDPLRALWEDGSDSDDEVVVSTPKKLDSAPQKTPLVQMSQVSQRSEMIPTMYGRPLPTAVSSRQGELLSPLGTSVAHVNKLIPVRGFMSVDQLVSSDLFSPT